MRSTTGESESYAAFRFDLLQRVFNEKLTPRQVADELKAQGFGQLCADEIERYYDAGDDWRRVVKVGHASA